MEMVVPNLQCPDQAADGRLYHQFLRNWDRDEGEGSGVVRIRQPHLPAYLIRHRHNLSIFQGQSIHITGKGIWSLSDVANDTR
jgi:hypothetical protein